jgi:hypothetical protein
MTTVLHDKLQPDAHNLFQQWRRNNPAGYFINYKGQNNTMLHHVSCSHIGDTEYDGAEWGSLTKRMKICSTDKRELQQWAESAGVTDLKECKDCL